MPSLIAEDESPFSKLPISQEASAIRKAFFEGDLQETEQLIGKANPADPVVRALDLGLSIAQVNLVDPLSLAMHTHDFAGGELGAFIPNGKEDPVKAIERIAKSLIQANPESAPHVADAICLAISLQLTNSVRKGGYIVLDDNILFTTSRTSAERTLGETLACEVLCSDPEARTEQESLIRVMFVQKFRQEKKHFFLSGLWFLAKGIASNLDPDSKERWSPVFQQIAGECASNARYASGAHIMIYGAHLGQEGAWQYLLDASNTLIKNPDTKSVTNLKVAFGYLGELVRTATGKAPSTDSESVKSLLDNLLKLGNEKETKIAMEVAGLKQ
jgi:hypothetical protein